MRIAARKVVSAGAVLALAGCATTPAAEVRRVAYSCERGGPLTVAYRRKLFALLY